MSISTDITRISKPKKILFGLGEFGQQIKLNMISMFLMFYLVNNVGFKPAVIGTMMLIARVWDAINDPIMGGIIDNTNTKWGKARPYLLFAPIPLAVFFIMCFAVPDLPFTTKLLWVYVAYIGEGMLFTITGTAYTTLIPRITESPLERLELNRNRGLIGFGGMLLFPIIAPKLINFFSEKSTEMARGYTYTALVLSVIFIICYFLIFFNIKENVNIKKKNKLNIKDGLLVLSKNKPFIKVFLACIIYFTVLFIILGNLMFYVTNYIKRPDLIQTNMMAFYFSGFVGAILLTFFVKKVGKKRVVLLALGLMIITMIIRFITRDSNITLYLILFSIYAFSTIMISTSLVPFITDTIEYGEWKLGTRVEGLSLATYGFAMKLGMGLGPAIMGFFLEKAGYVSGEAIQSKEVMNALFNIYVIVPLVGLLLIFVLFYSYKLEDKMPKIIEELALKRKENKEVSE